jgi:hypothetical protein
MPIPADELDDALEALRAAGHDASAFRFDYVPYPRMGCAVGPLLADIVVTHRQTGVKRIYKAGHRARWLGEFAADARERLFWPT